jgi:hypothetical protein
MGAKYKYFSSPVAWVLLLSAANLCGGEVRAAEERGQVAAVQANCPGPLIWDERFRYAAALAKSENFSKAKSVLEPALSDCDPVVRQRAIVMLAATAAEEDPEEWLSKLQLFVRTKLPEPVGVAVKAAAGAAVGLLFAWLTVWYVSVFARYRNRKKVVVRPLIASGGGSFDGQYFVAIAAAMYHKMRALQHGAALPAMPKAVMVMDSVASAPAEAVAAVASDEAGKLATALLRVFGEPRYICYGSAHFGGRSILIVIRLERSGRIAAVWERSSSPGRLTEDLKDLSFLALQAASADMRK